MKVARVCKEYYDNGEKNKGIEFFAEVTRLCGFETDLNEAAEKGNIALLNFFSDDEI